MVAIQYKVCRWIRNAHTSLAPIAHEKVSYELSKASPRRERKEERKKGRKRKRERERDADRDERVSRVRGVTIIRVIKATDSVVSLALASLLTFNKAISHL